MLCSEKETVTVLCYGVLRQSNVLRWLRSKLAHFLVTMTTAKTTAHKGL